MEKLVSENKTKFIGLSNYNAENISNVLSIYKIKPYALEVEFNPYLNQKYLKEYCDKEGIKSIALILWPKENIVIKLINENIS